MQDLEPIEGEKTIFEEFDSWNDIQKQLVGYFGICGCQRKVKSIIDNLYSIYIKIDNHWENGDDYNFTGAEWLLIALLQNGSPWITHGINCEYPILRKDDPFWEWVLRVKDNPNLIDN